MEAYSKVCNAFQKTNVASSFESRERIKQEELSASCNLKLRTLVHQDLVSVYLAFCICVCVPVWGFRGRAKTSLARAKREAIDQNSVIINEDLYRSLRWLTKLPSNLTSLGLLCVMGELFTHQPGGLISTTKEAVSGQWATKVWGPGHQETRNAEVSGTSQVYRRGHTCHLSRRGCVLRR